MSRHASSAVAAALAAASLLAACGSSSPGTSTSSGAGAPRTQAQLRQWQSQAVRFAACIRAHGVPMPDPKSPDGFKAAISAGAGSNPRSPAVQAAMQACSALLPGGGPPQQSPAQHQQQLAAALAFARCLRSHGFPHFPDPNSDGDLTHQMLAQAGIDIHQPAAIQAADACVGVTHGLITKATVARFVAGQ
jgi:hypothetical protein